MDKVRLGIDAGKTGITSRLAQYQKTIGLFSNVQLKSWEFK